MSEPVSPSREQQAARWFAISRRGVMSLEERAAYAAWQNDPRNLRAIAEFQHIWEELEFVGELICSDGDAVSRVATRTKFARPALLAATCAVSLVIGVLSYSGDSAFWTALDWTAR